MHARINVCCVCVCACAVGCVCIHVCVHICVCFQLNLLSKLLLLLHMVCLEEYLPAWLAVLVPQHHPPPRFLGRTPAWPDPPGSLADWTRPAVCCQGLCHTGTVVVASRVGVGAGHWGHTTHQDWHASGSSHWSPETHKRNSFHEFC